MLIQHKAAVENQRKAAENLRRAVNLHKAAAENQRKAAENLRRAVNLHKAAAESLRKVVAENLRRAAPIPAAVNPQQAVQIMMKTPIPDSFVGFILIIIKLGCLTRGSLFYACKSNAAICTKNLYTIWVDCLGLF